MNSFSDLLRELKALDDKRLRGKWKYDLGNQQVEHEETREPVCDICTENDLSGDLYGAPLSVDWNDNGEFIAAMANASERLLRAGELVEKVDAQLKYALITLKALQHSDSVRGDIHDRVVDVGDIVFDLKKELRALMGERGE